MPAVALSSRNTSGGISILWARPFLLIAQSFCYSAARLAAGAAHDNNKNLALADVRACCGKLRSCCGNVRSLCGLSRLIQESSCLLNTLTSPRECLQESLNSFAKQPSTWLQ